MGIVFTWKRQSKGVLHIEISRATIRHARNVLIIQSGDFACIPKRDYRFPCVNPPEKARHRKPYISALIRQERNLFLFFRSSRKCLLHSLRTYPVEVRGTVANVSPYSFNCFCIHSRKVSTSSIWYAQSVSLSASSCVWMVS